MDQLNVGVLYPAEFDTDAFYRNTKSSPRTIQVSTAHYEENGALRLAKRRSHDSAEIREMSPPISEALRQTLADSEVLLALDVPVDVLALAPRLRLIQTVGAGVGQFDDRALWARDVRLTTAAGVGAPPIAEFVMARVLQVWKHLRTLEDLQLRQDWQFTPGRLLSGRTMGIVGFGAIGHAVAQRARAFGMRVIATRRHYTPGQLDPDADQLFGPDGLAVLLAESDVLVLAAPETPETENLIGAAELAAMKADSVLCNVGRGSLLDEDALVAALRAARLGAAILDVARVEPLPAGHPFWTERNVYLSPHSAASQDGYFDRLAELFAANVVRYARGDALINSVTPEAGY